MPSRATVKGKYYENKLLREFQALGYEAWLTPKSGALGHNPKVKVPERVHKYLVGDVCVSIHHVDIPVEVKFRANAGPYKSIWIHVTSLLLTNTQVSDFNDCKLYSSINSFIQHKEDASKVSYTKNNASITTKEIRSWLIHTNILFLRLKQHKHWIILELK